MFTDEFHEIVLGQRRVEHAIIVAIADDICESTVCGVKNIFNSIRGIGQSGASDRLEIKLSKERFAAYLVLDAISPRAAGALEVVDRIRPFQIALVGIKLKYIIASATKIVVHGLPSLDFVIAGLAVKNLRRLRAAIRPYGVISVAAIEDASAPADECEGVIKIRSDNSLYAVEGIPLRVTTGAGSSSEERNCRLRPGIVGKIKPGSAVQDIRAGAPFKNIVAAIAVECVGVRASFQSIDPVVSRQNVT